MNLTREIKILALIILGFILIRSIHFNLHLNFSSDQASFSLEALNIWRTKNWPLLGPPASIHLSDRYLYQGSAIYYFQLLFLLLGNFEPIKASYFFMLFCALMVIPLYFGIKLLINQKSAFLVTILYAFLPYYIDYTRFLWNPNFQLSLLPLLILFMGLFNKTKHRKYFFALSLTLSIFTQFHFQSFLIIIPFFIYYFIFKRVGWVNLVIFILAFLLGFGPYLRYEFTHDFYNFKTLQLFIEEYEVLYYHNKDQSSFAPHYFLSLSLIVLLVVTYFLRSKITNSIIFLTLIICLGFSLFQYLPKPSTAKGMAENWNYPTEEKVNRIIVKEKLSNFNVVNLKYDTLSHVQKYLLAKEKVTISNNYQSNKYLFVISDSEDLFNHPAYEINTFKPSTILKDWQLNPKYKLYLLERKL